MSGEQEQNRIEIASMVHKVETFGDPDATTLMITWMQVIRDDNRRGVLAGTDRDGNPMFPVTYRPKLETINIRSRRAAPLRHHQAPNRLRDLLFRGIGTTSPGIHNNLSTSEYQKLGGPPLAPRGQFSRVISNLLTAYHPINPPPGNTTWEAIGYWDEVVAKDGVTQFLLYHFDGAGRLPVRDLRGIRPEGQQKLVETYEAWAADWVRFSVG